MPVRYSPLLKKGDVEYDGLHFIFLPDVYQKLKKLFPEKDFEYEVKKAERWLTFNKPKKDITRFLCNWLNQAPMKKSAPVCETPISFGVRTANQPRSLGSSLGDVMRDIQSRRS